MRRTCFAGLLILALNSAFLFSFSRATLFYEANVLLHLALAVALTIVAIFALRRTNANSVDPEDVQMHYTWMLCSRGLGDAAGAEREEIRFRRFKADEASQSITAKRRAISPEDNNERQPIHDHESPVK